MRCESVLDTAILQSDGWRKPAGPKQGKQADEIERALADRQMIVANSMIVVQMQVQKKGGDPLQPFLQGRRLEELEVPHVQTKPETRGAQLVQKTDQGPRMRIEDVFQRYRQIEPEGFFEHRRPEFPAFFKPQFLVKPVTPGIVSGVDHHQLRAETTGALKALAESFGGDLGHQRFQSTGVEIVVRSVNRQCESSVGQALADASEPVRFEPVQLRTGEADLGLDAVLDKPLQPWLQMGKGNLNENGWIVDAHSPRGATVGTAAV